MNLNLSADMLLLALIRRADDAASCLRDTADEILRSPESETLEALARQIRRYDAAVATMLDAVSGYEPRDHDAAYQFLDEYPRFNKRGATLAREVLVGRGKLD